MREVTYTNRTKIVQYTPKDNPPSISELVDTRKYKKLKKEIESSNVSEDEKAFLLSAATRHYRFSYSKIADYYASASAEMQRLMEHSALVVIDMNDAIENGYTTFSSMIKDIINARENEDA